MSLLLASFHTAPFENLMRAPFPGVFSNPVFILILLVAIIVPGELLSHYLKKKLSEERYVTFISNRRKVVLPIEAILYVESNDKEVLLHTQEGSYRTRTCISQWAERLDDRFVRIHRAYLINIGKLFGPRKPFLADQSCAARCRGASGLYVGSPSVGIKGRLAGRCKKRRSCERRFLLLFPRCGNAISYIP